MPGKPRWTAQTWGTRVGAPRSHPPSRARPHPPAGLPPPDGGSPVPLLLACGRFSPPPPPILIPGASRGGFLRGRGAVTVRHSAFWRRGGEPSRGGGRPIALRPWAGAPGAPLRTLPLSHR